MPRICRLEPGNREEIECAAHLIRTAFEPVALRHGITGENCASFPAYLPAKQLEAALKSSRVFGYCIYDGEEMIGFFMLRYMPEDNLVDVSRFAVLPARQGQGVGAQAVEFMTERGHALGVGKLYASVMEEDEVLIEWLQKRGFVKTGRLTYAGLPYCVAFMEKSIGA